MEGKKWDVHFLNLTKTNSFEIDFVASTWPAVIYANASFFVYRFCKLGPPLALFNLMNMQYYIRRGAFIFRASNLLPFHFQNLCACRNNVFTVTWIEVCNLVFLQTERRIKTMMYLIYFKIYVYNGNLLYQDK